MLPWVFIDESRLEVNQLTASDVASLGELLAYGRGEFGYPSDSTGGLGYDTPAYIRKLLDFPEQTLACRYNGHLVGFMVFAWVDASETTLEVRNVFVHPACRDGSVVYALFEALLEDDDPTCRTVLAFADPANRAAIVASRKFGFQYLPRRRYTLVSHIPLLLKNPVVMDFFTRRHLSAAEYLLYLKMTPTRQLGPEGDEEMWDGRSVCRYRFVADHDSLEVVIDIEATSLTALYSPELSCALRIGGSRRFDVDDLGVSVDIGNPTSSPIEGTVAWCDSVAPTRPVAQRYRLAPRSHTSLQLHATLMERLGQHRSAAIVCLGDHRIALTASYRLERGVALTGRRGEDGHVALKLRNRTTRALRLEACQPGQAEQRFRLDPGASRIFRVRTPEALVFRPVHKPHICYVWSPSTSSSSVEPTARVVDGGAVLESARSKARYDTQSNRLLFSSPAAGLECVRQRWTEVGPSYWRYTGGSTWGAPQVRVDADRQALVVERRIAREGPRLLQRVELLSDGSFDIDYQLLDAGPEKFATLLEFLFPSPVVTCAREHGVAALVPIRCEFPNRFHPVRPSQPWLQVDDGTRMVRLEWRGGGVEIFADVESLKVLVEFTEPSGAGLRLHFQEPPPRTAEVVHWSAPIVIRDGRGFGWLSAAPGTPQVSLTAPDGWTVQPSSLVEHVPTRISLEAGALLQPGVHGLIARGQDQGETRIPMLVLARPAQVRLQSEPDTVRLDNGVVQLVLSKDARGPILSLFGLGYDWLACHYPRFSSQGRDPEYCGGLALRLSANPDPVDPGAWVRDFSVPHAIRRGATPAVWQEVAAIGSLAAIGLPDVRVCRRVLMLADSTLVWIETLFENEGDGTAVFGARHALTPSCAAQPGFRMYGWSGDGRFVRQRTDHEAIALSRGGAVCGAPGAWLVYVVLGAEVAGNEQARFGFQLEARTRHLLESGAQATVQLFLSIAQDLDEALAAAEALRSAKGLFIRDITAHL